MAEKARKDQTQIKTLTKENKVFRKIFDESQALAPAALKDPKDIPIYLRKLIADGEFKQAFLAEFGISASEGINDAMETVREKSNAITAIGKLTGVTSADEMPDKIEEMKDEFVRMQDEQKKIMSMFQTENILI